MEVSDEVFITDGLDKVAEIINIFAEVKKLHFLFFLFFLFEDIEFINDTAGLIYLTAIIALVIFFLFYAIINADKGLFATVGAMDIFC